jgi:hypothetical protein
MPDSIKKILKILAFAGAIAAGILCIVFAILLKRPSLIALAVAAFFGGITGFIFGTSGEPTGGFSPPSVGGKFMGLPDWVVIVDAVLIVIAVILAIVIH